MAPLDSRDLPTLYRIASLIGRTDDPREALDAILAELMAFFQAASGSIALLNPDTGRLEVEVSRNLPADGDARILKLGQGLTGWVALHGRPLLVPDVARDPRYRALREAVRCEMAVPMDDHGQVIGVINLDHDTAGTFSPDDLQRLVRFTAEATAVVQRLWQLRHFAGKARQLAALITVGQSLVAKLDPQELCDTLTREARQILGGTACALYLSDPARRGVRLAAYAPPPGSAARRPDTAVERPFDACLAATVIRSRKPVEFPDIQGPEFQDLLDVPGDSRLRSALAAPLPGGDEVVGVLAVFTGELHRFTDDEKRLLSALASLGAVALDNSRLYARIFASEDALRKSERLTTLGLLAAEIAHEIRNPLTVIKLLHGHLGLEFPADDPRHKDVRVIREKLDQLEAIVSRVLGVAQAPASLHSRWAVVDLLDDTLLLIRLKLAQNKIHLRCEPSALPLVVEGHKGQLQQVLLNLLFNAMQAMPDGGELTVRSHADGPGDSSAVIDICDTGGGIPPAIRDRMFDSFLTGRADGTGLGLAIVKRILVSHHGDIAVFATGPAGTTMRITLPRVRA